MYHINLNITESARPAVRSALTRYVLALAVLGVMTAGSFILVRSLIANMKHSEVVIAEAADLRSAVHKTMLAVDAVRAQGGQDAAMSARAEAELLRSSTNRLLGLLSNAGVSEQIWDVVRRPETGLEPNIRMLVESAATSAGAAQSQTHAMDMPMASAHDAAHMVGGMTNMNGMSMHGGHNSAAMKAVDELIEKLRADSNQKQDHAALVHDAIGYGTLLLLAVEALIVFCPLLRTATSESQRADEATHELEYLATHDALTGLLNRGQIDRVLQVAVMEAASVRQQLGIVLLDMDEFKPINDSLGHAAGDAVLKAVAQRISTALRPGDLCGRLGGDEFIAILPDVRHEPDIQAVANQILRNLEGPIVFNGQRIQAKASIGYAMFPIAGSDVGALMSAADLAMYDAKRNGRGRVSEFSQQMRAESERSRTIEASLQSAFANREFELHYQTIHSGINGESTAVEALVRWRHPERGLLRPMEFLADVRRSGRMKSLTWYVLSEATAQYAIWRAAGYKLTAVHVNVGDEFLTDRDAQKTAIDLIKKHRMEPRELVLEITDDVQIDQPAVQAALEYLAEEGVTVAVDDFGVGSVSITNLSHPAIRLVKLDKTLIHAAAFKTDGAAVLASASALLRALGKVLVAEGIEDEEQQMLVRSAGIDFQQGYLFGRPTGAAELTESLAAYVTRGRTSKPATA